MKLFKNKISKEALLLIGFILFCNFGLVLVLIEMEKIYIKTKHPTSYL